MRKLKALFSTSSDSLSSNLVFAFGAQSLQLMQSILISFLFPKLFGIAEFGFWQLFIFYVQYGGMLHFGLNDGVYLKEGGKYYNQINFPLVGGQLRISIIFQIIILSCLLLYSFTFQSDLDRLYVAVFSSIYVIISNTSAYLCYILQAVKKIKIFYYGKMIDILTFSVIILILLLFGQISYKCCISVFVLSRLVCGIYYSNYTKEIICNILTSKIKEIKKEYLSNIKIGSSLVVSNVVSLLILGVGRYLVDEEWGIESFGKVSFSLMMVNFFLVFMSQASMVLFPELRRWDNERISNFYIRLRKGFSIFAPFVLFLYLPVYYIMKWWLPDYIDSLYYLIFLLPLCIFDGKQQLLFNTIYKVYNKVSLLLFCNIVALIFSTTLSIISVFLIGKIDFVVLSMLLAVIFRSVLAEFIICRYLNIRSYIDTFFEIFQISLFICLNIVIDNVVIANFTFLLVCITIASLRRTSNYLSF